MYLRQESKSIRLQKKSENVKKEKIWKKIWKKGAYITSTSLMENLLFALVEWQVSFPKTLL